MAQVALQTGATSDTWTISATPTLDTPAGADGERQILVVSWSSGGSVSAPAISGWSLEAESFITGSQNRKAIYLRVISGSVSAGTASPTFGAAVVGRYWAGSFNGIPVSIALVQDTSWLAARTIPATSAAENESLHFVTMASAAYPRSVAAVTGYTEVHDAYAFHSGGAYGLWLGINRKDVASGSVASSEWTMYDYTGGSESGDRAIYASIILGPIAASTGEGNFTITADLPIASTVLAVRTGSGALEITDTDTITVTVLDQNGDPIANVVPTVGAVSGGVFTITAFAATDADGETTATLTAAAGGAASLIVNVGAAYSTPIEINVSDLNILVSDVDISPELASIITGETQQFSAVVYGVGVLQEVVWEVVSGGGSVNNSGLYTAPEFETSATVRARAAQNTGVYADAVVTVSVGDEESDETGTVTTIWKRGGIPLSGFSLDYWIIGSADTVIASGSGITNSAGALIVSVNGQYIGESVNVVVNDLASDMETSGKIKGQQVVTVT